MRAQRFGSLRFPFFALLVALAACAPQRPAASTGSAIVRQDTQAATGFSGNEPATAPASATGSAGVSADKTLVIGIAAEVRGFSLMNNLQNKYVEDLIHGNLFLQDEQGRWLPALAAESPSVERGTWRLYEDGTSDVVYKLRPGLTWHDGAPFTVHDLVLWWKIALDKDLPYQGRGRAEPISRMTPLDDLTLEARWKRWDPEADTVDIRMMWPMPTHILEEVYAADKQRLVNHPFWNTGFVGLGAYKLTRFVPGSHLELTANPDYVLGAPKIRNVVVKFHNDHNALIAGLLSGDVHMTLHGDVKEGGLSMADGILLGTQWSASHEGKVVFHPYRISILAVQTNPEFQRPAALGDVRARQALLFGMDRQSLIDAQFSGFADVAHGWLSLEDPDYNLFADAITRFDYDPARAQRLLADLGWSRGADGMLTGPSSQRFELEYRAAGRDQQSTATILADQWKRIGIEGQLNFIPEARLKDHEYMAKFPGLLAHTMVAAPVGGATGRYICENVGRPENGWLLYSSNPAGYCNADMERAYAALETAFPFEAKMEPFKEMMRIALRDLPYLPLYFESEPIAVRSSVRGINRVPPKDRGRIGMHAYTWTLE